MKNKLLLDTHIFIWAMEENKRLPKYIKDLIIDSQNTIFISVATVWEITVKKALEKIKLSFDIESSIRKTKFEVLPIQISHALKVGSLPLHHHDPFDRLLIAQASVEKLILLTIDPEIKKYKVKTLS